MSICLSCLVVNKMKSGDFIFFSEPEEGSNESDGSDSDYVVPPSESNDSEHSEDTDMIPVGVEVHGLLLLKITNIVFTIYII